ncbi:MAG: hypothetical protein PVJ26_20200 [Anaerolineae bacterium]|jgi:hypothetical protein
MRGNDGKITVENVNVPGKTSRVNAAKYQAMKTAMLRILPSQEPGLTQAEVREAVISHLPEDLYPGGSTAGWWAKTVQLDLEAKDIVIREATKPLRWHQVKDQLA